MKKFNSPALLVIDMQRYFLEEGADAFLNPPPSLISNVLSLVESFRKAGRPIVFTRHAHVKGSDTGQMGRWWNDKLPWEGDRQSELIPELKPRKNELLIAKKYYSAFYKTEIEDFLNERDVDEVVICGVMTHLCVETSARCAFMCDYQPIVVSNACASDTKEHHEATLLNLGHGFAYIMTANEITNPIR